MATTETNQDFHPITLSIAVPVFNEADGLSAFFEAVIPVLEANTDSFEIVCVNDGSSDATWQLLTERAAADPRIRALDLSRNFGKEAALTAALDHCRGKAVIPMDADLQDPPELIATMLDKWREGYEVVLARRRSRNADSLSKRLSAQWFYNIFNLLSEIPIPANTGDYRLMDASVVTALRQLKEHNRFMKGLFAWVGFRQCTVEFDRQSRHTGQTKWKKWKLWNFALDGILAFSVLPLKVWVYFGLLVSGFSFLYGSFLIVRTLIQGIDVPGYASIMVVMLFLGGVQLIGLGVLGEYIARIYREVKQRPLYVIRQSIGISDD